MTSIYANLLEQKKAFVNIRKQFNSHKIGLEYQHGRRFIVLEQQYGRRVVMWKPAISGILPIALYEMSRNISA